MPAVPPAMLQRMPGPSASLPVLTLLATFACATVAAEEPRPSAPQACNGSPKLCDRPVTEVAFPGTHNAHASIEERFSFANQTYGIEKQLDDGIRAMMLDVYDDGGTVALCHGDCRQGRRPLDDALLALRTFLESHPNEVLMLQVESHVTGTAVAGSFERTGLRPYAFTPTVDATWPTLRELIAANTRLIVFYEDNRYIAREGAPDWYLPLWSHSFDTPFKAKVPSDLVCEHGRGLWGGAPFFTLNHFLTNPGPAPAFAEQVNHDPFFVERAKSCASAFGRLPNMVAVDFYEIGDLFEVVRVLNGL
jgi:hypothetical protein